MGEQRQPWATPAIAERPWWRGAVHLLWALPLAGAFAYVMLIGAGLTRWGMGSTITVAEADDVALVLVLALAGGTAVGSAVGFVPWTRRRVVRAVAGVVVGLAVAVGIAAIGLGG